MAKYILALCIVLFSIPAFAQNTKAVAKPATYAVKTGNSLSRIARHVYGNSKFWTSIALENNIQGPKFIIHPGQVLRIPNQPSFARAANMPTIAPMISRGPSLTATITITVEFGGIAPGFILPEAIHAPQLASLSPPEPVAFSTLEELKEVLGLVKGPTRRVQTVRALVTGYDACQTCCEKHPDDPYYGITAIGRNAFVADGVATEPKLIGFGTMINIPGVGRRMVDDTGGGMRQNAKKGIVQIDVRFPTHEAAQAFGKRYVDVEVYLPSDPNFAVSTQ